VIIAMLLGALMVYLTIYVHYEALTLVSVLTDILPRNRHLRLFCIISGVFLAHTVEVWLYAVAFYVLGEWLQLGEIGGDINQSFRSYLYFSTVSYTSLGLGDIYPTGNLRLVTGIEALNGLLLIAWSGTYTYLHANAEWIWPRGH
jgi:Ion channel